MPHLTMDELEGWIDDFTVARPRRSGSMKAIDYSWDRTAIDTALVYVRLDASGSDGYLRRAIGGDPEWHITFLPRPHEARVSAEQALVLADEVVVVSKLCGYLTLRTTEHLERLRRR